MLTLQDGKLLIKLAKKSINSYFDGVPVKVEKDIKKKFSQEQGVFVTLHKNGQLRGCIGFPEPVIPLYQAVVQAARAAAFEDSRFLPVMKEELPYLTFEISVLTVPEEIKVEEPQDYLKQIGIGKHGLIIRSRYGSGLLLPQVATQWGWSALEFLDHVCEKAGLALHAWQDISNKIFRFQAQIFEEKTPHGEIAEKRNH